MNRRAFLQTSLPAAAAAQQAAQKTERPNILWICTDQQRWDTIGALGNDRIRTPNLDRLADSGVAFTRAYCQSPICTPSRASFMTGCYASTVHVNYNGVDHFPERAAERLISRRLANLGYDCGLVGKLHLSAVMNRVELRPNDGYRYFRWSHQPRPMPFWPLDQDHYNGWLKSQGKDFGKLYRSEKVDGYANAYQAGILDKYHQTTWCANESIRFIEEKRSGPWMLNVNIYAPHPPFDPAPEYLRRMKASEMPLPRFGHRDLENEETLRLIDQQTKKVLAPSEYPAAQLVAAYYAMIEHLDFHVGRMLDALDKSGQRENTIVIFTSDHGELLGDHGLFLKGCRFYEGAVRVPLIFSWPGKFPAGVRNNALVELTDIVPTLYESIGVPVPDFVQGRSLMPLLRQLIGPEQFRKFVRCEYHDAIGLPRHSNANMLVNDTWKLVIYHGVEWGELYDLSADPNEFNNLWNDPRRQVVKHDLIRQLFDARMQSIDQLPRFSRA